MNRIIKNRCFIGSALMLAFAAWTYIVKTVDLGAIGPQGSSVGLSTLNAWVHNLTGVNMTLYTVTDWLGLVPIGVSLGFAILGLVQWIRRRSLARVDRNLLLLGGVYISVICAYLLFEYWVINYRPVLIQGYLEVSYPSSTTLLVTCVMPTAMIQLKERIQNVLLRRFVLCSIAVFITFMVVGRLLSGVHWISDIIGGRLLSASLVSFYAAFAQHKK